MKPFPALSHTEPINPFSGGIGAAAKCIELRRAGIPFDREKVYTLEYLGENVGTYQADIVVDNKIILELKSVLDFHPSMDAHGQSQTNSVS